jgi:hypothetical protein
MLPRTKYYYNTHNVTITGSQTTCDCLSLVNTNTDCLRQGWSTCGPRLPELTPGSTGPLEKITGPQLFKKFPHFTKLPLSQQPIIRPSPEQDPFSLHHHPTS